MMWLRILILLSFLFRGASTDELISARCQALCLHDLEVRHNNGTAQDTRSLKHHIIQICKDDPKCSSCTYPCRDIFNNVDECKNTCKGAEESATCESSCERLQKIFTEKPGACPNVKNMSNYECTALCHLDGDCGETEKCCSYGCSRKCLAPEGRDPNQLPIPESITVQERKRRRSIIIRWVMKKLTKAQTNSNSNVFVVQWRWGLHPQDVAMTSWQTVTVRNKPYAILKHLLSPGRFYQFRVGAVSIHGSSGFSMPSESFKLSKEAKAPGAPKELTLGTSRLLPIGLWNQNIDWSPPTSDLPIKNYQVSWAVASAAEADAFAESMRRRARVGTQEKRAADDDDEWGIEARDRHSVIVPSHSTSTEISGLFPNSVYIVEVHASVDSADGELQGEKGIVFVRTAHLDKDHPAILDVPTMIVEIDEDMQPDIAQVQTPHYDADLQTGISWLDSRVCGPQTKSFMVRTKKTICRQYQPNHHLDSTWHDLKVSDCSAVLRNLAFDCDYEVEISVTGSNRVSVRASFSTSACDKTPSTRDLVCDSLSLPLICEAREFSAICRWIRPKSPEQAVVIGYRLSLTSLIKDTNSITIVRPTEFEMHYEDLEPGNSYRFDVQALTNKGVGERFQTTFTTRNSIADMDGADFIERYPGGEIIELPLEAASSTDYRALLICIIPIIVHFLR